MYNLSSERKTMSAVFQASDILRKLAEPASAGESVKSALRRVTRKLPGWSYGRVRSVWYADNRVRISADEMTQLRRAAKLEQEEQEATNELSELRARLEKIEHILLAQSQELDREKADAARLRDS